MGQVGSCLDEGAVDWNRPPSPSSSNARAAAGDRLPAPQGQSIARASVPASVQSMHSHGSVPSALAAWQPARIGVANGSRQRGPSAQSASGIVGGMLAAPSSGRSEASALAVPSPAPRTSEYGSQAYPFAPAGVSRSASHAPASARHAALVAPLSAQPSGSRSVSRAPQSARSEAADAPPSATRFVAAALAIDGLFPPSFNPDNTELCHLLLTQSLNAAAGKSVRLHNPAPHPLPSFSQHLCFFFSLFVLISFLWVGRWRGGGRHCGRTWGCGGGGL